MSSLQGLQPTTTTSPSLLLLLPLPLVSTSLSLLYREAGQRLWGAGTTAPPGRGPSPACGPDLSRTPPQDNLTAPEHLHVHVP